MSLIYFDGMDQYTPVALPTTTKVVTAPVAVTNLTTVAADATPFFMDADKNTFCRVAGEDRVWRLPGRLTANAGGGFGGYGYSQNRLVAPYSSLATSYGTGLLLDGLQPVSSSVHLTAGFKMKVAYGSGSFAVNGGFLLAAFSADREFITPATTFGIVIESNQRIYIRQLNPTAASDVNTAVTNVAFAAGTFIDSSDGFIGTSNFICGANTGNPNPAVDVLAANTVEVQYTAAGKISVWVNNMFAGTATFADPSPYTGVRYIKTGVLQQTPSFGNGITQYCFLGITDVYMLNGLGTRNTSRLGKVKVVSRSPISDAAVQFVRPDTSNSNAAVAAQTPPLINPSLTGTKAGDTDLYNSAAFNFTNEAIIGTAVTTVGYKTDPSGNDIAPVLNVTGTNYVGNANVLPISTSLMKSDIHIYEINPKTGLPFTKADLDATTFGVTVVVPS